MLLPFFSAFLITLTLPLSTSANSGHIAPGLSTLLCYPLSSSLNLPDPSPESIATCNTSGIAVRLPPSLSSVTRRSDLYKAMPAGWLYGNWKATYSSQASYFPLHNTQWDLSPLFPQSDSHPGQINDLASYQLENSTVIYTSYGVDTPRRSNNKTLGPEWDDVYHYGWLGDLNQINGSFEALSWGYDTLGVPYLVLYDSPIAAVGTSADIDIFSRSDTGPSKTTVEALSVALQSLNNTQISQYVRDMMPLVQDGARRGLGPVVCDAACVNNTNSALFSHMSPTA
ncbi:hypothetical protein EUX98_g2992 [Antrodiella citrinella]|uniref:Uncharacterized protein n=1 Tax=Antrodiella citrinella TaxID=2447956 RepID=A0A4V3XJ02_9APHY|nr:hypothetical protein EUX98_g2992 [Antrodiella citrinella]